MLHHRMLTLLATVYYGQQILAILCELWQNSELHWTYSRNEHFSLAFWCGRRASDVQRLQTKTKTKNKNITTWKLKQINFSVLVLVTLESLQLIYPQRGLFIELPLLNANRPERRRLAQTLQHSKHHILLLCTKLSTIFASIFDKMPATNTKRLRFFTIAMRAFQQ